MPVIHPAKFPTFFKTVVLKRKQLLEKARKIDNLPIVFPRRCKSTWNREIVFSGRLDTTRLGISMRTFLVDKDPIIFFNQTREKVFNQLHAISIGKDYLDNYSSWGKSIYPTCTLSQFTTYVFADPTIPRELKILAKQFQKHSLKPKTPNELLKKKLNTSFSKVKNEFKVPVPKEVRKIYVSITEQAHTLSDVDSFTREIDKRLNRTMNQLVSKSRAIETTRKTKYLLKAKKTKIVTTTTKIKNPERTSKTMFSSSLRKQKNKVRNVL